MSNFERKALLLLTDDMLEHADTLYTDWQERDRETLDTARCFLGMSRKPLVFPLVLFHVSPSSFFFFLFQKSTSASLILESCLWSIYIQKVNYIWKKKHLQEIQPNLKMFLF